MQLVVVMRTSALMASFVRAAQHAGPAVPWGALAWMGGGYLVGGRRIVSFPRLVRLFVFSLAEARFDPYLYNSWNS